jgi:hypothetical protein
VSFEEKHGCRVEVTYRHGETLFTIVDYWVHRGQPYGTTGAESDAEFRAHSRGTCDREGEGASLALWLPKLKERMRDLTHYIDSAVVDRSRQMKDPSTAEREHFRCAVISAAGSLDQAFLSQVVAGPCHQTPLEEENSLANSADEIDVKAKEESADEAETGARSGKKARGSDIVAEGPKQHGNHNKDLLAVKTPMLNALQKLQSTILDTHQPDENGAGLQAYRKNAFYRLCLAIIVLSSSASESQYYASASQEQLMTAYKEPCAE